ncbi:MAG: lipopolysaccharide biosynthesis protein, partial [Muribaculaceae bacterium]|nr:lipopolysaccharide biosynthesis protein [Muribaculaceae bacterium]
AFAIIFVDSGFGAALLREKEPTQEDYSTVFWFNLIVSVGVYALLYLCAPLIARLFDDNDALIPMSKVMFLTFVINGLAIVQTNRLMKRMEVKMIAVSNSVAIFVSGIAGVILAFHGYGAWAMVWYSVIMAAVKTLILWLTGGWWPSLTFSRESMRKVRRVGVSVFSSSLLNTISQNVYNFVIGVWYGLAPLGVYTQADKYSKMFTASISQVLTASFVPLLSGVQDSVEAFRRYCRKTGRFAAFILLPAMLLLTVTAPNLFHALFAEKWDDAIILFQILCVRGIFVVLVSLYSNYLLSLGKARHLIVSEGVKDGLLFVAIFATVGWHTVPVLVWGLLGATIITWLILLYVTAHGLPLSVGDLLRVNLPFLLPSAVMCCVAGLVGAVLSVWLPEGVSLHINA